MKKIDFNNLCDFIKIPKDTNISIIFPSREIFKREYGTEIDNSDYVIRFNDYVIDSYEKYVGTKTDLLLVNNETIKNEFLEDRKYLIIGATRVRQNININLIDYCSVKLHLRDAYNFYLDESQLPTAGFLIITMLVENKFENINIFGFEDLEEGEHKYTYYYKDIKNKNKITHNYQFELSLLKELDRNKKIKLR